MNQDGKKRRPWRVLARGRARNGDFIDWILGYYGCAGGALRALAEGRCHIPWRWRRLRICLERWNGREWQEVC